MDAVARADRVDMAEGAEGGELQPEVPVFVKVEGLVEAAADLYRPLAEEQCVDGDGVFDHQARGVVGLVIGAHRFGAAILVNAHAIHAGIRGDGLGFGLEALDELADVLRLQPVVVVEEEK